MVKTLPQHLDPAIGPKRILALDGGGIRGALTLGYLAKLENILADKHPDIKNFRLCHYFDLIGGTSTGSIIAAALAIGKPVSEITEKYFSLGEKIFGRKNEWWNVFEIKEAVRATYDAGPLEEGLSSMFHDYTLGDDQHIKTGLCIVAKRADTNSVWPMINHPQGKFFDSKDGDNKNILLKDAIRASAAAPTYFLPMTIKVRQDETGAFVDGGVSMANNPALQLFMVATLNGFPFHWKKGADEILLVSIGTGMTKLEELPEKIKKSNLLNWAKKLPDMFMQDASWHNQVLLQWMSKSPTAEEIDSEIGDLSTDYLAPEPLLTYIRYNVTFTPGNLNKITGKQYSAKKIEDLSEMSNAKNCRELYSIGEIAGNKEIDPSHFPEKFNL
jgi:patatin-like phospholipase/acyl hydrolase